jgi:predicted metal-dependent hydrolase
MANHLDHLWTIEGVEIPVRLYQEWRNSNRISITKDRVIIRVPKVGSRLLKASHEKWAKDWLASQLKSNGKLKDRFQPTIYRSGQLISTAYRSYQLSISKEDRKSSKGTLTENGKIIQIVLSRDVSQREEAKAIKSLISRLIAKDLLTVVSRRIHELNQLHFNEEIKDIRLKNNKSNWGSCSANGNINISIRTLFAPLDVQDYIFIHELAHLKELNHSAKYWQIVSKAMPNYKTKEAWIKTYGASIDF